ncbi:MAG: 5-bromo-4-chloroindolyl phosphate hydrolysis family protein [Firmicutes bacterium]|nr:5-bromo-4-chloroindolyl phosphate hydrolysis family protein [Bacillota bacterium]
MNSGRNRGGFGRVILYIIGIYICLQLIPILGWALNLIVIFGAIAFGVMLIALVVSAIKGTNKPAEPRPQASDVSVKGQSTAPSSVSASNVKAKDLPELSPEEKAILKTANQHINESRLVAGRIQDASVRDAASKALSKAELINKVLREQPESIKTCHQFLNYYLPTLEVVIKKFGSLESSGVDIESTKAHMLSYLSDIGKALDKQYTNLFENEKLDLSVEMEAMQNAFKRDGLIAETEIPVSAETEIKLTV